MARTQIPGSLIKANTVDGADLIAGTPAQILVANASGIFTPTNMSGDATISNSGVITVGGGGNPSLVRSTTRSATATLTVATDAGLISCDATIAAFTLTLPPVATSAGYQFAFVKTDITANIININSAEANVIIGGNVSTLPLKNHAQVIVLRSNGTKWIIFINSLPSGNLVTSNMAAEYNLGSNIYESINRFQIISQSSSTNAANITLLNYGTFTSANPSGFIIPRNAIIKALGGKFDVSVASPLIFNVTKNGVAANIASLTVPAGSSYAISENPNILINAGDRLTVSITNITAVSRPELVLELAWR